MKNVYFAQNIEKIINNIDYSKLGQKVAIKVHFGEAGCTTYMNPAIVKKIYQKIESFGKKATLVECNVLYKGSRTNQKDHLKTARNHGFVDMDIDILDGENGEKFVNIDNCKIGAGIKKYDSIIVISHFKGHGMAGFGGAIKNVGMGLGSRAGKLDMHSNVKPFIDTDNCIGCSICANHCDVKAITINNGKAFINNDICIGCAMCIAVCPHHAASVPWDGGTSDYLQHKIAQYAKAVLSIFPNPVFINILEKITKDCDCRGSSQKQIIDDIGILYSTDILAIDQASLDLVNQLSHQKFNKINKVDKEKQLKVASKIKLGKSDYQLIKL
jgi:hypothetical protein